MKQFRMDNTSGFSQSELDTLNAAFEAEAAGITDPDHLKFIADSISNRADDILKAEHYDDMKAIDDDIEAAEKQFHVTGEGA
jgi:hypothetical protein